ncbi:MAG: SET domain-containing protein-lysine N-methyltransferase [Longimicrobiales bacterium]|nr:SET domain-containing protein-lysine N-methyltransferase [Longimicrobiales bacterium]
MSRRGEHLSVLATDPIGRGEAILEIVGHVVKHPTRHSVQAGRRAHISGPAELPPEVAVAEYGWRFLNHSCEPNAFLRGLTLMALEDIPAGAEITFDYNTTEWEMAHPFACLCGTPACVGVVRGYRHLDDAARGRLLPFLAEHLRVRP